MSLQNLLEKITTKHKERQESHVTEYMELVTHIVAEKEPDPAEVERILRNAGKTFDDLQQSVLARQQRKELRAQLDRCVEMQKPQAKLQKQIAAADRDLEEAETRHAQVTGPLYAQLREMKAAAGEIPGIKIRLEQTCDNPLVREPLLATRARIGQVSKRQGELIKKRNDSDAWAKSDRQELATDPMPGRTEQLIERATLNESVVAKSQAELVEVEQELALLFRREELLREQTLVP